MMLLERMNAIRADMYKCLIEHTHSSSFSIPVGIGGTARGLSGKSGISSHLNNGIILVTSNGRDLRGSLLIVLVLGPDEAPIAYK